MCTSFRLTSVSQRSLKHCLNPKVPFLFIKCIVQICWQMLQFFGQMLVLIHAWVRPPFRNDNASFVRNNGDGSDMKHAARQTTQTKFLEWAALNWCNYVIRSVIVYVEHICTSLKRSALGAARLELNHAIWHAGTLWICDSSEHVDIFCLLN